MAVGSHHRQTLFFEVEVQAVHDGAKLVLRGGQNGVGDGVKQGVVLDLHLCDDILLEFRVCGEVQSVVERQGEGTLAVLDLHLMCLFVHGDCQLSL